ncbi:hypothetical protein B0H17DRAFT_1147703 [Mycena rosella]|uniref:Uncharacterized protein n=1 Tax=Mycena rosella TaxID=1033263 RepID=A0AAD7FY11_MYCRO|nr:hypothetical protein B0H17DRAFT_1147703 [Mycena rosella]
MPKNSRAKDAALRRHRDRRGEIDPKKAAELASEDTYTPDEHLDAHGASDDDLTPAQLGKTINNLAQAAAAALISINKPRSKIDTDLNPDIELQATSKGLRRENADLIDAPAAGSSASTLYREAHGKTRKARAKAMQPSVATFFSKIISTDIPSIHTAKTSAMIVEEVSFLPSEIFHFWLVPKAVSTDIPSINANEAFAMDVEEALHVETGITSAAAMVENEPEVIADFDELLPGPSPMSERGQSPAVPTIGTDSPKLAHSKLERLIEKHIRLLRKPKTMLTNTTAANQVFDLEALRQFNNQRFANLEKLQAAKRRVELAPSRSKAKMRKLVPKIKPSMDASETVATALAKGPAFARRLRKLATHLETHGELPKSTQGQGAFHFTLLDNPDILSAVRVWCSGALDFDEGGFEGPIKPAKLRRYVNDFLLPSLDIENIISESTAVRWLKKLGFKMFCNEYEGDEMEEISAQLELAPAPTRMQSSVPTDTTDSSQPEPSPSDASPWPGKGRKKTKPAKPTNKREAPAAGRTEAEHSWTPPPAPEGSMYRLPSFDARRIIYPGANHDPWWDMPQLLTQTRDAIRIFDHLYPDDFRERADGTFPKAQKLVPEALDQVTAANIRRYFRCCFRYMDAYRLGLNVRQAAFAVKKYTSHRRVPASVM